MQEYARQANDKKLIGYATEVKERAERCGGALLQEMEKNKGGGEKGVGRAGHNAVAACDRIPPKLADLGITKSQSSRWQKKAHLSEEEFEQHLEKAQERAFKSLEVVAKGTINVRLDPGITSCCKTPVETTRETLR